jgi:DegV family protein with EDD domain
MLRIVTDGAVDMPDEWQEQYDIDVLPLRIRFGDQTYVQGDDIDRQSFYQLVAEKKTIPGTSLPSPSQVAEFYRQIANRGDDILSIHLSTKLSGTFSVVQMAANELTGEFHVIPFDSGAGSAVMGFMCREARRLNNAGTSLDDILSALEEWKRKLVLIFTLDSLDFARMNGRVTAIQSVITSMLKIKPIIILHDGLLEMADKVRTRQRALDRIIDYVYERLGKLPVCVAVVHANDLSTAQKLLEDVNKRLNVFEAILADLSIPVAANLGPGTVGIIAIPINVGNDRNGE